MNENSLFSKIPKMDKVLQDEAVQMLIKRYGYEQVKYAARKVQHEFRTRINKSMQKDKTLPENSLFGGSEKIPSMGMEAMYDQMQKLLTKENREGMQHVINATGVILHTNLGRAPLGEELVQELLPLMTGYSNLELDLGDGKRGSRYDHFSGKLCGLTGAEAAIAVNNNAAAVLVMLSALTSGQETIVSRGELVEIGGKFRIPDVCLQSGTILTEVGTTNRTYLADYENAITENTAAILKVHTSNYQITGFTHEAGIEELAELAHNRGLFLLADLGSGCLKEMEKYGFDCESAVDEFLKKGVDIVCFSGDKLLGGPQAGILAGKKELIQKISAHPLMRAVRIDKFTAAALDKTLAIYLRKKDILKKIPLYEMVNRSEEQLWQMGEKLLNVAKGAGSKSLEFQLVKTENVAGGGSGSGRTLPGAALRIKGRKGNKIPAQKISERLRQMEVPVIGHIQDDWVYLEMRTILPGEMEILEKILREFMVA